MGLATALTMTVLAVSPARADGDPKRGEKIFEECRACHSVERGVNDVGPDLHGVFGRRAAAAMPERRGIPKPHTYGISCAYSA